MNTLMTDAEDFCRLSTNHSTHLHSQLSAIMMAQDFQDLTGQVIGQVIHIAQEIEESLVELIRVSGQHIGCNAQPVPAGSDDENTQASWPQVPGLEEGEVVNSQDEVDDLLSSLGF